MANMKDFSHKTLVTKPYDLTYSYYLSPNFKDATQGPADTRLPILLFVHGYPDDAWMWEQTVKHVKAKEWPMICLDLLGFGHSSKPTEAKMYNYKQQADSIAQILDAENIKENVIPIGHDWGSGVSQRFYLYHRERCSGLALLCLAYQVPSPEPFSLPQANELTAQRFGYPQWEYWNFFTAPDAPEIMRKDLKRFFEVNNGIYESPIPEEKGRDIWMREMFCVPGAMRDYMLGQGRYEDYTVPLKPYPDLEEVQQKFIDRLSRDGLEGPVNYYHSLKDNTMLEDERLLCDSPGDKLRKIEVPLLYIGTTGDWVCRTDLMNDAKKLGLVPDCEEKVVDAGHWVMYEKPDEIGKTIEDWLVRRF